MPKILFFGELKSITGHGEFIMDAKDLNELKEIVIQRWPELISKTFVIACDKTIAHNNMNISDSSEIAFLPPYSGG